VIEKDERLGELFAAVSELPVEEQAAFLASECVGQPTLLAEIESLLGSHAKVEADGFMHERALDQQARGEVAELSQVEHIGQAFGRYRILSLIGEGGMGEVYLAADIELDRRVAIKLIKSGFKTKELLRRFATERQILAQLNHENIARLVDVGTTADAVPFLVMEYVDGRPIGDYCNSKELSISERLKLFRVVCAAVQYAHQNLIIHRDLKPSNILVTSDGQPKLLDFGIAKLLDPTESGEANVTATMLRVMTPEYASPEQIKSEPITTASDVYSLGVLLYQLLTGHSPYKLKRRTTDEITKAVCEQEPTKPSSVASEAPPLPEITEAQLGKGDAAPPWTVMAPQEPKSTVKQSREHLIKGFNPKLLRGDLDNIVLKALRKEPLRRYATVEQFSDDIRRHLEGLPVIARKDTLGYRTSKFVKRNKIGVAAAALILLTLVGGIIATAWEAHRARVESAKAQQQFNQVRKLAHSVMFDYHDEIAALPGSTKVRERLVKDALEYLDNLSQEAGNDPSLLRELAAAYEKVAMVQGGVAQTSRGTTLTTSNLGDTPGAKESMGKALAIRERVSALEPANKDVRKELAYCYVQTEVLYLFAGPPDKAVEYGRKAMPILESLLAADPANEELQYNAFAMYSYLARALGCPGNPNLGDTQGAFEYFKKAELVGDKLVADDPKNLAYKLYMGGLHGGIGLTLDIAMGKPAEALEHYKKGLTFGEELYKADPGNSLYRRELALELGNVGRALLAVGDKKGAVESCKQALAVDESFVTADPNDADTRKRVAIDFRNLATALAAVGDHAGALENYRKAEQIFVELIAKDPTNADSQAKLEYFYLVVSRFYSQVGDLSGAIGSALQGVKVGDALVASSSSNALAKTFLAQLYREVGDGHAKLVARMETSTARQEEQWRAAKDAYQKSLDIYQDMKSKGTLKGTDADKPDEIAKEIAKCDEALKKL
jgi:non-specific serine/threonine protein kinase/serine/threonine-protein kinase